MRNTLLLPNKYKIIGWILFLFTTIFFFIFWKFELKPSFFSFNYRGDNFVTEVNLLKEIIFTFWMLSLMLICFAKEKQEDEYISFLRLSSWQYAVLVSLIISIIGTWAIYGWNYLTFSALNMLTVPLVFIGIFNVKLYQLKGKELSDEK